MNTSTSTSYLLRIEYFDSTPDQLFTFKRLSTAKQFASTYIKSSLNGNTFKVTITMEVTFFDLNK